MSTTYRFPTLDVDALRSLTEAGEPEDPNWREQLQAANEDNISNDIHERLFRENHRLCSENSKLRHCLVLTKENCDLKSANYATSAMTWCDDRLRNYMSDVLQMDRNRDEGRQKPSLRPSEPTGSAKGKSVRVSNLNNDINDQIPCAAEGQTGQRYTQQLSSRTSPIIKLHPNQYQQFGPSPSATRSPEQWQSQNAFSHEPVSRNQQTPRRMSKPTDQLQGGLLDLQRNSRNSTPVEIYRNENMQSTRRTPPSKKPPWKPWNADKSSASPGKVTPRKVAYSAGTSRNGRVTTGIAFNTPNPRMTRQWTQMPENNTSEAMPRYISPGPRAGELYASQDMEYFSRNYNAVGQPIAQSTPVAGGNVQSATDDDSQSPDGVSQHPDSLAILLGISGKGSKEKAKSVVYRPVDTITGYRPTLSIEQTSQLWTGKPNRRLVGEIAFQLDRRILELIFSGIGNRASKTKNARYYGYSLTNVMQMIKKESRINGVPNAQIELQLRERLLKLLHRIAPIGYVLEVHAEMSQDMVNKYGLLNGPPDQQTMEYFGLESPVILRILVGQILKDDKERDDMLVSLDCLCFLAHEDNKPLFMW